MHCPDDIEMTEEGHGEGRGRRDETKMSRDEKSLGLGCRLVTCERLDKGEAPVEMYRILGAKRDVPLKRPILPVISRANEVEAREKKDKEGHQYTYKRRMRSKRHRTTTPRTRPSTRQRGIRLRRIQRKLQRTIRLQIPRASRRPRAPLIPNIQRIRRLRQRRIRVRLLIRINIPNNTTRRPRDNPIRRSHRIRVPVIAYG